MAQSAVSDSAHPAMATLPHNTSSTPISSRIPYVENVYTGSWMITGSYDMIMIISDMGVTLQDRLNFPP
jgi:hypothetical protein